MNVGSRYQHRIFQDTPLQTQTQTQACGGGGGGGGGRGGGDSGGGRVRHHHRTPVFATVFVEVCLEIFYADNANQRSSFWYFENTSQYSFQRSFRLWV